MTPESVRSWMAAFGGRRFLMCMSAHFVNTGLFVAGTLSEQGYLVTFASTIGAYLAASGWQKHVEAKSA